MDSEEELYRKDALKQLPIEFEESLKDLRKRFNNEIGRHEAMDRVFIINENIESFILNHPYIVFRPECYKLAFQASELIAKLYQKVGSSDFNQE